VSRALRLSIALALLVGVTLGLKLSAAARTAEPDGARLAHEMSAALAAQGFSTAVVPHHLFDYVIARKGNCTLAATNAIASGYLRERFAEEVRGIGPVAYHYGDGPPAAFPRFIPVLTEHLQNWAYQIGIVGPRVPVIGIAASPACRLDTMDWAAFRIWPRRLRNPN